MIFSTMYLIMLQKNWFDLEKTVYEYCLNRSKSKTTDDLAMRDSDTFEVFVY